MIQRLPDGKGWVNALAFSQTRGVLAAGGEDGVVRVWVSESLRLSRLPVPRMTVLDLAWIQSALSANRLTPDERGALEFVGALIMRRHRHDVIRGGRVAGACAWRWGRLTSRSRAKDSGG